MNCKTAQLLLSAYLDSELSGGEMLRLRKHLCNCKECRQEEEELRSLKTILTGTPMIEPPADFEERLCSAIFAPKKTETSRWMESWSFVSGVALVTAAVTLLVVNHLQSQGAAAQPSPNKVVARELQRDQALSGSDPFFDSTPSVTPTSYDGK